MAKGEDGDANKVKEVEHVDNDNGNKGLELWVGES